MEERWWPVGRSMSELNARPPSPYLAQQYFKTEQDRENERLAEQQRRWAEIDTRLNQPPGRLATGFAAH